MALNNDAVITAAKGYVLRAPAGTAAPTPTEISSFIDGRNLPDWEVIGHTSRDELPEFGYDGGDTEARGTWQNEALKTVTTETAVDYVTFNLVQFDEGALELYYGQPNSSDTPGVYAMDSNPGGATEMALLIVIIDGQHKVGFHATRVEVRREDAITLAVDEFGALPLRATFLSPTDAADPMFSWIDETVMGSTS